MRKELFTPHFFKRTTIVDASTGCWLYKGYRQTCGYGQLYVEGRRILAHRMSWIAHKGEIPAGMLVCHTCDTPRCVNPEHLFLGTHKDNSDDCVSKGRAYMQRTGADFSFTRLPRSRKLSEQKVQAIRESTADLASLSEKYKVSKACISMIRNGKRKKLVA